MPAPLRFTDAVDVVNTTTFAVFAGVALTHFISESEMVEKYKEKCTSSALQAAFYWSSVCILSSLALRFLLGSKIHLLTTYGQGSHSGIAGFLHDAIFLFVFGVFLIKAAWAKHHLEFGNWLVALLAGAVLWASSTRWLIRNDTGFVSFWLPLDAAQLVITLVVLVPVWRYRSDWPDKARKASAISMLVLAIVYLGVFAIDVIWMINKNSG